MTWNCKTQRLELQLVEDAQALVQQLEVGSGTTVKPSTCQGRVWLKCFFSTKARSKALDVSLRPFCSCVNLNALNRDYNAESTSCWLQAVDGALMRSAQLFYEARRWSFHDEAQRYIIICLG